MGTGMWQQGGTSYVLCVRAFHVGSGRVQRISPAYNWLYEQKVEELRKAAKYKINTQKSVALLYANELSER